MNPQLDRAQEILIQGLSRISYFWGLPKGMGTLFGVLYLSSSPLSLDVLVEQSAMTKGAVSTNVRALERLGMVHLHLEMGDRKDYYTAETDFWKITRAILKEREQSEFDQALRSVTESIAIVEAVQAEPGLLDAQEARRALLYQERMKAMQAFFHTIDNLVAAFLALDEFRLGALQKLLGK